MPKNKRGGLLTDNVLFSECDNGLLIQRYDEEIAKRPECIQGRFGTSDRLTLPRDLSNKLNIAKAVTLTYNNNGTILITPVYSSCLICGSAVNLHVVGNRTDKYICDACLKRSD